MACHEMQRWHQKNNGLHKWRFLSSKTQEWNVIVNVKNVKKKNLSTVVKLLSVFHQGPKYVFDIIVIILVAMKPAMTTIVRLDLWNQASTQKTSDMAELLRSDCNLSSHKAGHPIWKKMYLIHWKMPFIFVERVHINNLNKSKFDYPFFHAFNAMEASVCIKILRTVY